MSSVGGARPIASLPSVFRAPTPARSTPAGQPRAILFAAVTALAVPLEALGDFLTAEAAYDGAYGGWCMASFFIAIWEAIFGKPAVVTSTPDAEPVPIRADRSPAIQSGRPALRRVQSVGDLEVDHLDSGAGNISFTLRRAFYAEGRLSPNGRYLVGACDGHEENGRSKNGAVVLVDARAGRELFRASLKRANNPHVSDDGLVLVENWKGWGGPLAGAFLAFDSTGKKLWEKAVKANVYGSGMAVDGRTAFFSTCNSDHEAHSGKTWLLDARTGEEIWERDGFGHVRFEGSRLMVGLAGDQASADNRFFPLDEHGNEPSEYHAALQEHEARINRGKPWWVFPRVQERLGEPDPPLAELERMLVDVEEGGAPLAESDRARIERWRGEIAERRGDVSETLRRWERALLLDPKVGIKRRYDALVKKSG